MLKILKRLRKQDWLFFLISILFIVAQVDLDLQLPGYMSEITRLVQTEGSEMSQILSAGGKMLLCAALSMVFSCITGYFVARIAAGLSMRLREDVYGKVLTFSMSEIGRFETSSLITRTTNDITQIQMFVSIGMQAVIKAPIMAIWAIVKIAGKSWQWTAVTAGAVAVLVAMIGTISYLVVPRFRKVQTLTDDLNRVTRENLSGIRVVRAYNAEEYQLAKSEKVNEELTSVNLFTQRVMSLMQPGMSTIQSGLTLAIYWIGAFLIAGAAGMTESIAIFSDMVVFSSYAMQVIMAFMLLTMTLLILPRATVSAKRINEVLDTEAQIRDGEVEASEPYECGEIEFRNVTFRYPGAEGAVLSNISFKARHGETVAIIGTTGSGKSTLINLIPRFYDVTSGEVLVDGINVKEYRQKALRGKIGYVPQKGFLFSGSVESNIAFASGHCDEEHVKKASWIAQADEFVSRMDGGYKASIAQSGTNISGGQKQRLSIARAVYRRPEIYIFDDSFSALDYRTDRAVRSALKKETAGTTTIIVAQRIGTIMDADRIIVLDKGQIAGMGTHKELLETCPVYQEIAASQLTEEEMKNA